MLSLILLISTFGQTIQSVPSVQPKLMYLVISIDMWSNWCEPNFNRIKALGDDLPITHVIFLVSSNDSSRKVSQSLYDASKLGLNFIYGIRHSPDSKAEFSLSLDRNWHNSRIRELQIINTTSYAVDTTRNNGIPINELELFNATQPWSFLRKKLYVIGSVSQYTRSIALQAKRGNSVSVLDFTLVDYHLASDPDKAMSDRLQYWIGHVVGYIPGLYLVYRNDPVVLQKMVRFSNVAFFVRPVKDDIVHFGLPEWSPIK